MRQEVLCGYNNAQRNSRWWKPEGYHGLMEPDVMDNFFEIYHVSYDQSKLNPFRFYFCSYDKTDYLNPITTYYSCTLNTKTRRGIQVLLEFNENPITSYLKRENLLNAVYEEINNPLEKQQREALLGFILQASFYHLLFLPDHTPVPKKPEQVSFLRSYFLTDKTIILKRNEVGNINVYWENNKLIYNLRLDNQEIANQLQKFFPKQGRPFWPAPSPAKVTYSQNASLVNTVRKLCRSNDDLQRPTAAALTDSDGLNIKVPDEKEYDLNASQQKAVLTESVECESIPYFNGRFFPSSPAAVEDFLSGKMLERKLLNTIFTMAGCSL